MLEVKLAEAQDRSIEQQQMIDKIRKERGEARDRTAELERQMQELKSTTQAQNHGGGANNIDICEKENELAVSSDECQNSPDISRKRRKVLIISSDEETPSKIEVKYLIQ